MADKLLIILMNTDPTNPAQISAPIKQARVAAAMDYEVEIILGGRSGNLARRGLAETLIMREGEAETVYDLLKLACEEGVKVKLCRTALDLPGSEIIDEIDEVVGDAYLISEAMDDDTVTLTY